MFTNASEMSHHLVGMLKFDDLDGWEVLKTQVATLLHCYTCHLNREMMVIVFM